MQDLRNKLKTWQKEGFISAENVAAILGFEKEQNPAKSSWWLYSLLTLGAVIIFLGVVSLIAANWSEIPATVKLLAAFLNLLALSIAAIWQYQKPHSFAYEALMSTFLISCLGTLFLITHLYSLDGHWFHRLLLWSAICLPAALFTHRFFNHFLWVSLTLPAIAWSSSYLVYPNHLAFYQRLDQLILLMVLSSAVGFFLFQYYRPLRVLRRGFAFWFPILAVVTLAMIDLLRSGGEMRDYELIHYLPTYIAGALLAFLILIDPYYRNINKALLLACLALVLLYFHPQILFDGDLQYTEVSQENNSSNTIKALLSDDIIAPILTILILFLYAIHSGIKGHTTLFNTVTFLIGLRFIVFYFQAMGGLATTGIRLIISGLLIIATAWVWYKSRHFLQRWSKRLQP